MKMKLKKIVICFALMVLAGSVFGVDIIRSRNIGQYEIRITYDASLGYVGGILDHRNHNLFCVGGWWNKSDALDFYNSCAGYNTPSKIKGLIDYFANWSYVGENAGYSVYMWNGY
ncbi:MAG: hypothetical protein IKQ23_08055 [Treponema sp.]|nr:hypothetical protein [Treponema sp.]